MDNREQMLKYEETLKDILAKWQVPIASILDHPSVYMGGPSHANLRKAKRICEFLAEEMSESDAEASDF